MDLVTELKSCEGQGNAWNSPQEPGEQTRGTGNQEENQNCRDYCIAEVSKNTQESPGFLRRLSITQTPVKVPPS